VVAIRVDGAYEPASAVTMLVGLVRRVNWSAASRAIAASVAFG
jgi:hypothetical protein